MRELKKRLAKILIERSYREGDFTLASGRKSDYYFDCRQTALHPEGSWLIGTLFNELLADLDIKGIGGMTLGGALSADPATLEGLPTAPRQAAPAEFDPQQNPRVYETSRQLRCLVCQNENIADSNAELAIDLRREVAAQVKSGKTDDEIIDFMVERYGDYVLYNPPFKAKTFLLWCGPAIFFLVAFWAVWRLNRRRKAESRARRAALSEEAYAQGLAILKGELVFREGAFHPVKKEA